MLNPQIAEIELLSRLRRVRYSTNFAYKDGFKSLRYSYPDTRALCQIVFNEEDMAAQTGAQEVLSWLNGDQHLLRPAEHDIIQVQELVRASQGGVSQTQPDLLLVAANAPKENAESHNLPSTLWHRLFGKRLERK
jgi:hypothetical protein